MKRAIYQLIVFFVLNLLCLINLFGRDFEKSFLLSRKSFLNTTDAAANQTSVLSSGDWYKIAVSEEGIYKISYSALKNMGINVDQLNPKYFRLFGNGGAMLPQKNSDIRFDDLQENNIKMVGGEDGKFDTNDYVLFYAQGNIEWKLNASKTGFLHERNIYSDTSYYFINIGNEDGKRISMSATGLIPNNFSTSYDDLQLHEKESYSAITANIKSGREWYGEDFANKNNLDFSFDFKHLIAGENGTINTNMAVRSNVGSYAQIKVDGQNIGALFASATNLDFENDYAISVNNALIFKPQSNSETVSIGYDKPNALSNAWVNFVSLQLRKVLNVDQDFLRFRDLKSIGAGKITQFSFDGNLNDKQIWEVSDVLHPIEISETVNAFVYKTDSLKEFVCFSNAAVKEPLFVTKVVNQNLHGLSQADMLILAPPQFTLEAERLANFRKTEQNISVHVVSPEQIYNEFSSGARDASAIRDFVKMFYNRASATSAPKYLLLFGAGSFDNRNLHFKNNNFIVTYQSRNSLSPTQSYTSDDYFALLDNDEGEFSEAYNVSPGKLDISVGRIPVVSVAEAKNVVEKLIAYADTSAFGDWRNKMVVMADDEDDNIHFHQAEANAQLIGSLNPNINISKIYFDAYQQESTSSGMRYPEAETALNNKINEGFFLLNYTGHGGVGELAQERVLQIDDIYAWKNKQLPIIFTATCSFGRWDDPETASAGEIAVKKEKFGVIALFTATRIVYSSYNFELNQSFFRSLYAPEFENKKISFGEVFKLAKNNNAGGLNINSRNFTLMGDPSALFPIPANKIETSLINNTLLSATDSIKGLEKVNVKGEVKGQNNQILENYNGVIYPVIYDKPLTVSTLGQDAGTRGSYAENFLVQENIVYKGKASVKNGAFSFDFIVPKDIAPNFGKGKISYYSNADFTDAVGSYSDFIIGGLEDTAINDKTGPEISLYINDDSFVNGGITGNAPSIFANLKDESGINTSGIGIGHDITAILTNMSSQQTFVLNQWYQAKQDTYKEGTIKYPLEELLPGKYELKLKAWDVFNNSSEKTITFEVVDAKKMTLANVSIYPNPFRTQTTFQFEHNLENEDLDIQINIYSIAGKLIKTINQAIFSAKTRVNTIFWEGTDEAGNKLPAGIYIYQLKVRSIARGEMEKSTQKLIIL